MNIGIIAILRWNGGSSRAILNYQKTAPEVGCDIKILSKFCNTDSHCAELLAGTEDLDWPDHVICVFETHQFLTDEQIKILSQYYGKPNITIIDPDGRYGDSISFAGDTNHDRHSKESWENLFLSLSQRILQPNIGPNLNNAHSFSYFGMESKCEGHVGTNHTIDIQYIGNNWHRWAEVQEFVEAMRPIRHYFECITFRGRWWDSEICDGHEKETESNPMILAHGGVEVTSSVPVSSYLKELAKARLTPIFVRKMLAHQGLITPRSLETLSVSTVPILWGDAKYLTGLYGKDAEVFCVNRDTVTKILELRNNYGHYQKLWGSISSELWEHYNYKSVLLRLLRHIECLP